MVIPSRVLPYGITGVETGNGTSRLAGWRYSPDYKFCNFAGAV